jgi:Protein of unknown function (DUF1488)
MALDSVKRPGYANAQGVHFAMLAGNATIRVLVTRAALQGGTSALQENFFLIRFNAYRDVYEIAAKQKFETGDFKGSMTISMRDLESTRSKGSFRRPGIGPIDPLFVHSLANGRYGRLNATNVARQ